MITAVIVWLLVIRLNSTFKFFTSELHLVDANSLQTCARLLLAHINGHCHSLQPFGVSNVEVPFRCPYSSRKIAVWRMMKRRILACLFFIKRHSLPVKIQAVKIDVFCPSFLFSFSIFAAFATYFCGCSLTFIVRRFHCCMLDSAYCSCRLHVSRLIANPELASICPFVQSLIFVLCSLISNEWRFSIVTFFRTREDLIDVQFIYPWFSETITWEWESGLYSKSKDTCSQSPLPSCFSSRRMDLNTCCLHHPIWKMFYFLEFPSANFV